MSHRSITIEQTKNCTYPLILWIMNYDPTDSQQTTSSRIYNQPTCYVAYVHLLFFLTTFTHRRADQVRSVNRINPV